MTDSPHLLEPRLIEAARAADIVALAKRAGARLKDVRAAEWKWAGPCPGCGGTDRFALNKELGIFNCRRFGGGDTIAMVRHALGLDFVEAVEFIVGSSLRRGSARRPSAGGKTDKVRRQNSPDRARPQNLGRERRAPRNDRRALSRRARARFGRRYRKPSDPVSSFARMAGKRRRSGDSRAGHDRRHADNLRRRNRCGLLSSPHGRRRARSESRNSAARRPTLQSSWTAMMRFWGACTSAKASRRA